MDRIVNLITAVLGLVASILAIRAGVLQGKISALQHNQIAASLGKHKGSFSIIGLVFGLLLLYFAWIIGFSALPSLIDMVQSLGKSKSVSSQRTELLPL